MKLGMGNTYEGGSDDDDLLSLRFPCDGVSVVE